MSTPSYEEGGVLMLVGREPGPAVWTDGAYEVGGYRFTVDTTYAAPRLFPEQPLPEGYMGWFGDSDAVCDGGPIDGETVRLMQRGETPEMYDMLST